MEGPWQIQKRRAIHQNGRCDSSEELTFIKM
jgi:hypothetical protein